MPRIDQYDIMPTYIVMLAKSFITVYYSEFTVYALDGN